MHNEAAYKPGEVIKVDCNTWCVEGSRRGGAGRQHRESWPRAVCSSPGPSPGPGLLCPADGRAG